MNATWKDGARFMAELRETPEGFALVADGMELRGDFARMLPRLRADRLARELLVRAARVKGASSAGDSACESGRPWAIDMTAGLGEDSLLLAATGFAVTLYECDPVIAALLRDALQRAAEMPELAEIVARMELVEGDSVAGLSALAGGVADGCVGALRLMGAPRCPDVVYLDPMFPERTKSAAVKKKFQLLHHLEAPCANEEELVRAALAAHPRKVVIKRPVKGPNLADIKPAYSLAGKAVRYDVLVPASTRLV